jgi:hypothetical protein
MACYDSDASRPREAVEDESAYEQARADVGWMQTQACCMEAGARGVASTHRAAILRGLAEDRPSPDSGARYDAQAAAACLDVLTAPAPCWQLKTPFPPAHDRPCARIYRRGNRQLGEVCRSSWDCAEHARGETTCGFGSVTPDGIIDVCKLQRVAEEGEPCADDDPETEIHCEWPLLCDPQSERCVARAERGERCITGPNWGDTCASGSVCDRLNTERCIEPIGVGEACTDGEQCEGSACVERTCRPPNDYAADCEW